MDKSGTDQLPTLNAPVDTLKGVGPRIGERLQHLGIRQVQDLLFHLPHRYIDRTRLTPIGALRAGDTALCQGTVELVQVLFGRRRSLVCRISDGTGAMTLRFFHFTRTQQANLQQGTTVRCWGQIRTINHALEMVHPEYSRVDADEEITLEQTLTPVYPLTQGLSQFKLRNLTGQALNSLSGDKAGLTELLPDRVSGQFGRLSLGQALRFVHRPPRDADLNSLMDGTHPAQQRLVFEELLAHHLSLRLLRKKVQARAAFPIGKDADGRVEDFLGSLPFALTGAQQRILAEVRNDMARPLPMLRLIQGDVGSGKTVVAATAALQVIHSGFQVALMAPTEILADQHYFNIKQWFLPIGIPVLLLTGKQARAEKAEVLARLNSAQPTVVVGTHALFQEQVAFSNVGLIIIDEQHRFGVDQRLALLEKGMEETRQPHQLVMTATPIPRTIAMTLFADLDISVIDQLPPGRQPIKTTVLSNEKRGEVIERIHDVCRQGRQAYWVCTLIENSETLQLQAAEDIQEHLARQLSELNIGLIHGRMKSSAKEAIMDDFKSGRIDLLVATTVIEVGVDVANASLMIIENAERLGLSQLHQLRGRVGRGSQASDCVLLYQTPLSGNARMRLNRMRETGDGFAIAKSDLELRGPGEILGKKQTGVPELHIADFVRDAHLIPRVQQVADHILARYPKQVNKLISRWLNTKIDFGKV